MLLLSTGTYKSMRHLHHVPQMATKRPPASLLEEQLPLVDRICRQHLRLCFLTFILFFFKETSVIESLSSSKCRVLSVVLHRLKPFRFVHIFLVKVQKIICTTP